MFKIIPSTEIRHRHDFGLLATDRKVRVAVEVGTDRGVFAKQFMNNFMGEELVCIDPYISQDEFPWPRTADMQMALMALHEFHGRVRLLQLTSEEAMRKFPWWHRDKIDFVYVDGQHNASVEQDLNGWWDMLSDNGILAGHDFDDTHPEVQRAVENFANSVDSVVRVVDGDHPESWYIYKQEPAELMRSYFIGGSEPNAEKT